MRRVAALGAFFFRLGCLACKGKKGGEHGAEAAGVDWKARRGGGADDRMV